MNWVRFNLAPGLIEAPTGAGKSFIVGALAKTIHEASGKRILCIQPNKELTEQNHSKYLLTGNQASIFSASLKSFSTRYPVIYGTDKTIWNRIKRFKGDIAAIILDEAHGITPTIKAIIDELTKDNPNLRVIGLTATPYRLKDGYIYSETPSGVVLPPSLANEPYFRRLVYQIKAQTLLDEGYLTQPLVGKALADSYKTASMKLDSKGQFKKADVDKAYHGHGRLTADIVSDVVRQAQDREGCLIFAATIQHAEEVMASLPPELSAMVTGKTSKADREAIIASFRAKGIKYLVNVAVFTTGFDVPHVDVIALLRATESVGLLQQMVGRGLRIAQGKEDCLVLDYAENMIRHCPDGDIFKPTIQAKASKSGDYDKLIECPSCGALNFTKARHPEDPFYYELPMDRNGYYVQATTGEEQLSSDGLTVFVATGERLLKQGNDEHPVPIPAHYTRRCHGIVKDEYGEEDRCDYRWTCKICDECGAENDIAARYCTSCKAEIVDPNEKLKAEFARFKKDPYQIHSETIEAWYAAPTLTRAGKNALKCEVRTPYRQFMVWAVEGTVQHRKLMNATTNLSVDPVSIKYRRNRETDFFDVIAYNTPIDEEPS